MAVSPIHRWNNNRFSKSILNSNLKFIKIKANKIKIQKNINTENQNKIYHITNNNINDKYYWIYNRYMK